MKSKLISKYLVASLLLFNVSFAYSQLTILSGIKGGSYNQVANDINKVCNNTHKITLSKGSYYSFHQLMMKPQKTDVAFLQADVMFVGVGEYEGTENVKVLLPLGQEEIHLIVKKSSNINALIDLSNKFIGIGSREQGTNITARFIELQTTYNFNFVEVAFEYSFDALMKDKIDAFYFVGSIPVDKLKNLDEKYKNQFKLVPITDKSLARYYHKTVIKAGTYDWVTKDVETYAVDYVLATNIEKETPEKLEMLTKLLTDIKNNIEKLKKEGHPVWKQVDFDFKKNKDINYEIHPVAKKVFGVK